MGMQREVLDRMFEGIDTAHQQAVFIDLLGEYAGSTKSTVMAHFLLDAAISTSKSRSRLAARSWLVRRFP